MQYVAYQTGMTLIMAISDFVTSAYKITDPFTKYKYISDIYNKKKKKINEL